MANRLALSAIVATLAFWAYTQTLLPGVDMGDTGGFQAAVLWPEVSARQAYPLYYGLARPFVAATTPGDPARALNLFSAVWAAAAVGLLTYLSASITRSLAAGAVAGTLLAFSYTFWTQAVIAEVYSLHLALVGLCLAALAAYAARPTTARLAVFFAVYAASFGNHLSMILLLGPCALFLVQVTPQPRELVRMRVMLAAGLLAVAGALQYSPNFMAVWQSFSAPEAWGDRLATFWFDTTKEDWRELMVLGIGADQAADRTAMWWFDARQQFGVAGLALAAAGAARLWRLSRPWASLSLTTYAMTTAFALTYNVGDTHVFLLPGHFMTALCAGVGAGWCFGLRLPGESWRVRQAHLVRVAPRAALVIVRLAYAGWRGWTAWPAVDRHTDRRGEQLIARLTLGVSDRDALFVSQMNWQIENVLLYTGRYLRPDLAWARLGDVLPHWPFLVADNHRLGRDVVMNGEAAAEVLAAYGPAFPIVEDSVSPVMSPGEALGRIPRGMPYVLSVLTPPHESPLDPEMLAEAIEGLTGGRAPMRTPSAFELFAGVAGERPQVYRASNRPFTERFQLLDEPLTVRMDSWLPSDTFRRAGFGHVLRGRDHILILERGLNLVWLGRDGSPSTPYYAASLFAAQPRYRIPAATPQLATLGLSPGP